jgi:hypothetical protein
MNFKKIIIVCCLVAIGFVWQAKSQPNKNCLLPKNIFSITANANITQGLSIRHYGEPLLNTDFTENFQGQFSYRRKLSPGMLASASIGLTTRNYYISYDFEAPLTYPGLEHIDYHLNGFLFSSPVMPTFSLSAAKYFDRGPSKRRIVFPTLGRYFFVEAGVGISYEKEKKIFGGISLWYISPNEEYVDFFSYDESVQSPFSAFSFAKVGLSYLTVRNNLLSLNLAVNYSPFLCRKATYRFYNLPFESYGDISRYFNFVGLELSYGFSFPR